MAAHKRRIQVCRKKQNSHVARYPFRCPHASEEVDLHRKRRRHLAIAISANTAIFSLVNAALLKLLPVPNPNQLIMRTDGNASMVLAGMLSGERSLLGYEEFTRLRDCSKTLSGLCASRLSLERWPVRIGRGSQEQVTDVWSAKTILRCSGLNPPLAVCSPKATQWLRAKIPGQGPKSLTERFSLNAAQPILNTWPFERTR